MFCLHHVKAVSRLLYSTVLQKWTSGFCIPYWPAEDTNSL